MAWHCHWREAKLMSNLEIHRVTATPTRLRTIGLHESITAYQATIIVQFFTNVLIRTDAKPIIYSECSFFRSDPATPPSLRNECFEFSRPRRRDGSTRVIGVHHNVDSAPGTRSDAGTTSAAQRPLGGQQLR